MRTPDPPQGRSAIVKFYGYGPDNMFDSGYRRGQPLFTLTRGPRGIEQLARAPIHLDPLGGKQPEREGDRH